MSTQPPACDVCGSVTVRTGDVWHCINCGNKMALAAERYRGFIVLVEFVSCNRWMGKWTSSLDKTTECLFRESQGGALAAVKEWIDKRCDEEAGG